MLIYSTRIKVKNTFTKEQFVKSVIKWCMEKDYPMHIPESHLSELSFTQINENQMLDVINIENGNTIAARQTSETLKGNWTVDAVLNCDKQLLSVYMDYTVNDNTTFSHTHHRTTWLINQIINDGFAENNLGFELKTNAIILDNLNKDILLAAINSSSNYALPIVYLSARSKLNADSLALKLAGHAVVINDPLDLLFNSDPTRYNAPIYVFIPHKMMEPICFGDYPFHRDIIRVVADFLNSRNYDKLETWEGVNGEVLRQKSQIILDKIKKQNADSEFDKTYIAELEAENNDYAKNYENLVKELQKLKHENERLNFTLASCSGSGVPIITSGRECDLYPDEQKEILIEILKDYLNKNITDSCRRSDIIKSIISANPVQEIPEKNRKIIKDAFYGYTKFSCTKILDALKETGIVIAEHTGHYKLRYHNDPRYSFEAAATPSDNRAGKNAAAIINKLMF